MTRPALARTAGILCSNTEFRRFLAMRYPAVWAQHNGLRDAERAAAVIRVVCDIESRSDLDRSAAAARRYHTRIGLAFSSWRAVQDNITLRQSG